MGLFKNIALRRGGSSFRIKLEVDPKEQARLESMLAELPNRVFKRVVRSASSYAMTPVLKAARKLAPKDEGALQASLIKKTKSYPKAQTVWTGVGPKGRKAPHAHLVEFGHMLTASGVWYNKAEDKFYRLPGNKGKILGFVAPRPFLRPAFNENKTEVLWRYRDKLMQGIQREAGRTS